MVGVIYKKLFLDETAHLYLEDTIMDYNEVYVIWWNL